jgi:hypothetical protein
MTVTDASSAARQNLVTVAGLPGFWATKTGGAVEADTAQAWNGGSLVPEVLASPSTTSNVTVTRPYKPLRDGQVKRLLRGRVGQWRTTVSVQDTDADLTPIGTPDVYADALLVALRPPEFDASSGDAQVMELEFAVSTTA